jgi:hypothetical protein
MRRNRSEMKPFPTSGGVTLAPVAKTSVHFFGIVVCFSQVRD